MGKVKRNTGFRIKETHYGRAQMSQVAHRRRRPQAGENGADAAMLPKRSERNSAALDYSVSRNRALSAQIAHLPMAETVMDAMKIPDGVVDVANGIAGVLALRAFHFNVAGFHALLFLVLAVFRIGNDAVAIVVGDGRSLERSTAAQRSEDGEGKECGFIHE